MRSVDGFLPTAADDQNDKETNACNGGGYGYGYNDVLVHPRVGGR